MVYPWVHCAGLALRRLLRRTLLSAGGVPSEAGSYRSMGSRRSTVALSPADILNIPLSTRIRGGFGGYGCLFFSQHLWGFFEVADLGYLFVFFNSTRIY